MKITRGLIVLALLLVPVVTPPPPVGAVCPDAWVVSDDGSFSTYWEDVTIADATHGWAVGYTNNDEMTIAAWDGSVWTDVTPTLLGPTSSALFSTWAISPTDVWAAGSYSDTTTGTSRGLLLHWNGAVWQQETAPDGRSARPRSLWADATGDVWAAGVEFVRGRYVGMVLHRVDSVWTRMPVPRQRGHEHWLDGITGTGPKDLWAVGYNFNIATGLSRPLALHWDGVAWSRVRTPPVPDSGTTGLSDVSALDASHAWAVGYLRNSDRILLERWDGVSWHRELWRAYRGSEALQGVVAVSSSLAYAVGYHGTHPLILRWNGTDWSPDTTPWTRSGFADIAYKTGAGGLVVGRHNGDAIVAKCA
jgi:hypothetical protein